jgi:hypothetical protein
MRPRQHAVIAAMIALAGWSLAAAVYVHATRAGADADPESEAEIYDMTHSRAYLREVERIAGKASVFASEVNEALAAMFRGRALAGSIAIATSAVAGGYLLLTRAGQGARADGRGPGGSRADGR